LDGALADGKAVDGARRASEEESRRMPPEEIIAFWGAENMVRWRPEQLEHVAIPDAAKLYLLEVGLPAHAASLDFGPRYGALRRFSQYPHLRQIGSTAVSPVCLDEEDDGAVVELNPRSGWVISLYNTSVQRPGERLVGYEDCRHLVKAWTTRSC